MSTIANTPAEDDWADERLYEHGGIEVVGEPRVGGIDGAVGFANFVIGDEVDIFPEQRRELLETADISGLEKEVLVGEKLVGKGLG